MKDTTLNPIEYFRMKSSETDSGISAGNMARAIDSFSRFIDGTDIFFDSFNESLIGEWAARQFFEGYYSKTVAYNISKLAALYNKAVAEGIAKPNNSFSLILNKIKGLPEGIEYYNHSLSFQRIRDIFITDYSGSYEKQLAKDILLFGILQGGLSLKQIIGFKKDDYSGDNIYIRKIVERYSRPKNKYLFPLRQGRTTDKKISESISALITNLLDPSGRRFYSRVPDYVLRDLWCDIAMSIGISASDIKACMPSNEAPDILTFCATPSELDSGTISEIIDRVDETIVDNPVKWYAMHLRNRVELKDLTDRLTEKKIKLDELYYPMEDIIRKVGKKKMFEHKPIISWLVFYRAKATQLNTLFREIGDIAWGYRYVRDVRSPYAVISNSEVMQYQTAIGTLSPSTVITTEENIKIRKGDNIVILGGPMIGHHGVLLSEKKEKGDATGRTIYKISLDGGNNIAWEVSLDSRLVKKL